MALLHRLWLHALAANLGFQDSGFYHLEFWTWLQGDRSLDFSTLIQFSSSVQVAHRFHFVWTGINPALIKDFSRQCLYCQSLCASVMIKQPDSRCLC